MDGHEPKQTGAGTKRRRGRASAGLVASGLIAGAILAGTHVAGAASQTPTSASATVNSAAGTVNPATMTHGPGETLLTDGNAEKAKAAALAAVPGGTIIRVETDSAGSAYEAHVRKADGSIVTVKFDKNFDVTSTDSGFRGAPGQAPPSASGA
jgi:hypothetical protein